MSPSMLGSGKYEKVVDKVVKVVKEVDKVEEDVNEDYKTSRLIRLKIWLMMRLSRLMRMSWIR